MSSPSFYFSEDLQQDMCSPIITVPDMMSILKMIYSPHFKDKLLSIDKIINDNPKDTITKNKLKKTYN